MPQPSPASAATPFRVPSLITRIVDGRVAAAGSSHQLPIVNPADESALTVLVEDDAAAVDEAVRSARAAFDTGPWPRLPLATKRRIMGQVRDTILAHAEELAYLDCLDTGIPLWDIRGRKMSRIADNFQFAMDIANTLSGETYQQNEQYLSLVTHSPVGVAAILAPWNSPMSLASMQIAPCIAFGNTCVIKPSEFTPLSVFRLVQLMHEAGLPPGVVNLVNGRGTVTGAALASHPGIDLVKFTGGTATGKRIMAAASGGLKKVGLELGGKSANIILEDANFDAALTGALLSIFSNNGQQCLAGSRILVQRPIADRFIAAFVERVKQIKVGDPLAPDTEIGPMAFREHYERVLSYVDIAREDGAQILVGGTRAPGFDKGYYFLPTAVLAPNNRARVCRDEIFAPFATFLIFDTEEEAIAIANDSDFGLVGYVWTQDVTKAMGISQRINAGTILINTSMVREVRAPFGGFKQSGIGRDGLRGTVEFFTEPRTTTIPLGPVTMRPIGTGQAPS
jgi:acyl-CoA reductase-like NAD-dependent aldehyde dehydrogenase